MDAPPAVTALPARLAELRANLAALEALEERLGAVAMSALTSSAAG